jgi:hypothetical protein
MADDQQVTAPAAQDDPVKPGLLDRYARLVSGASERFHVFVSLPIVTLVVSTLAGHFQYLTDYQTKVDAQARQQVTAAETTYAEIAGMFAKAITLQQLLVFNFRDAIAADNVGDDNALETKAARALFPQYDALRVDLREKIDLLARKVELNLDWSSDPKRDAATVKSIGTDPVTLLALGNYEFDCDEGGPMANFRSGTGEAELTPPEKMLEKDPKAKSLRLDWYSAKHELLTLYYCFNVTHRRILPARQWATRSPIDPNKMNDFKNRLATNQVNLNREAVRLNTFITLAARRIETIEVKFRPLPSYCHLPFIREIIDFFNRACTPIRLARG